jgi:oligoribonuclease NrnB/cAMP/cGMP phosphodiesterase (DHH superfamily)
MVKLFTDSDLDGLGCGLLAKMAFGDQANVTYCTYRNLNQRVSNFLEHGDHKQQIFITDLSVDKENELKLQKRFESGQLVQMVDHHVTALHFNEYEWGFVKTEYEDGRKHVQPHYFMIIY